MSKDQKQLEQEEFEYNIETIFKRQYEHEINLDDAARKRWSKRQECCKIVAVKPYLEFDDDGKLVRK